jgi:streptogramin lyase
LVWRVDPRSARLERTFEVGGGPGGLAVGAGAVWTADAFDGTVTRIEPDSGQTTTIDVGGAPNDVVVAHGLVWVTVA